MAVYKSKYRELTFYVDGELHAFSSGSFSTTDERVIAVLDELADALRVDESEVIETKPEKPAQKTPAKRKPSGK
ncbi:hypothetical protein [Aneurinibacillus aneurinilyticus]|jgi:hypothetical protein|uniref:Uncharacterized protein n=1 Tax=Aneurinibacillus aneurinilyticus TaxID=1391 RepID=A0A848D261_ANEAE|nr:hypothetical protein [Aneurinibacillus aneurinilyticus]NMF00007.1 hypothetical protein [Aneurinibacillus aneurinilyticus]